MLNEDAIKELIEMHLRAAKANGERVSVYNYHVGAVTALKAVLEVA